jgi:hypothetical protein
MAGRLFRLCERAEEVGGKIVLTPAVVVETEHYTDDQVARAP